MSRKSKITIVVGLVVFSVTLMLSFFSLPLIGFSSPETINSPQKQIERGQLAQTVQTTFVFLAVVELLMTGILSYKWRRSDISDQLHFDNHQENQKGTSPALVWFSIYAGSIAFVTSYIISLLEVFVFDIYGGLSLNTLTCTGVPAGLFGILGGFLWCKVAKRSRFTRLDLIPLAFIGIVAGLIPGACIRMIPQ